MSWLNFLYKVKTEQQPNAETDISASLYVNYWKLPTKDHWITGKGYKRWLDIGVILEGGNDNIEEIVICFPFKVKMESIQDLSKHLESEKLVSHILEKRYRCLSLDQSPTYHYLQPCDHQKNEIPLYLYEICKDSKEIVELVDGCAFKVKILSYPKNSFAIKESSDGKSAEPTKYRLYFQFRINSISETDLSYNEAISNDLVQSAFSKSEMIDILFNDLTNIDHSDHQSLTKEHELLSLSNIDFAFIGSSEDETIMGNKPFYDCELLDERIWNEYMNGINPKGKKCIAYHWDVPSTTRKIFFKTVFSSLNLKKFITYSLYVILLSFLASFFLECCKFGYTKVREIRTSTTQSSPNSTETIDSIRSTEITATTDNKP